MIDEILTIAKFGEGIPPEYDDEDPFSAVIVVSMSPKIQILPFIVKNKPFLLSE